MSNRLGFPVLLTLFLAICFPLAAPADYGRGPGYRYLRAKGNSIEGGTSEILRNTVSERVLGLPGEHRVDKAVAWKDLPR